MLSTTLIVTGFEVRAQWYVPHECEAPAESGNADNAAKEARRARDRTVRVGMFVSAGLSHLAEGDRPFRRNLETWVAVGSGSTRA
jgi:hypothetical protein